MRIANSEVESEAGLEIEKEAIQNQKVLTQTIRLPRKVDLENTIKR